MKIKPIIALILVFILLSCDSNQDGSDKSKYTSGTRDLPEIIKSDTLKVLTTYSATSYFLYKGSPMGYEYELLELFAKHLGLKLDIKVSTNLDSLIDEVNTGRIDLVAHGLSITNERRQIVEFSDYLYLTHQALVQKKPDNWRNMHWSKIEKSLIHDPIELIGDTISVRKNSAYFRRINNLMEEIGGQIYIDTVDGNLSTGEIIKKVVDGEIKHTIADDNIASINASYYPILDVDVPISFSQRIAWAVSPGADSLLLELNKWLAKIKKTNDYYVIYNKYFKNKRNFRRRVKSELFSLNESKISEYDEIIKKYSEKINIDWRLIAAQIYQESKFEPYANSWAGANGLMQIMPETAHEIGITDPNDPDESIRGGTYYLKQMYDSYENIQDSTQRLKFALASYNCGLYHVKDAQALAKKQKLDPNRWDANVDEMILKLSYPNSYNDPVVKYGFVKGIEPYTYVNQIFGRYSHYLKFIED